MCSLFRLVQNSSNFVSLEETKTTGSLESDRRECRKTRHKVALRLFIRDDNVFWKRKTREKSIETLVVGGGTLIVDIGGGQKTGIEWRKLSPMALVGCARNVNEASASRGEPARTIRIGPSNIWVKTKHLATNHPFWFLIMFYSMYGSVGGAS